VSETLFEYHAPVRGADGRTYRARACGGPLDQTLWEGWLEFVPLDDGDPIRSRRETTQPNRTDCVYWATGLSPVYLEGALQRAVDGPIPVSVPPLPQPPAFSQPAPSSIAVPSRNGVNGAATRSVLDPYSAYEKGEPLLRKQLSALSAWHLVNVIVDYELSQTPVEILNATPAPVLVDLIVRSVQQTTAAR